MTDRMHAVDARALAHFAIDGVVNNLIDEALEFVAFAARKAFTSTFADIHPEPSVQESFAKKLEELGYRVEIVENDQIKISWSK